jgi:protein-L-isoaspartate O-methyltransferase
MTHKPNPHTTASFGFQRSLKAHGGSARKISLVLCQTDLHRSANLDDLRIEQAFRSVKRERFAGPGPWWLNLGPHRYVQTPDDDPAFLYQDLPLALDREREINMGMPSAHACWLGACTSQKLRPWQIGAGSGYYTAILAHLVGAGGRIYSYEIDEVLAERARDNLKGVHQVEVRTHGKRVRLAASGPDLRLRWCHAAEPQLACCIAARWAPLVALGSPGGRRRHVAYHAS